MLTDEMFVTLVQETAISSISSFVGITVVIIFITGSFFISFLTLLTVFFVDVILVAIMNMSDLTFNNITLVHLIASLGISVLYTVHISHTFLLVEPPKNLTRKRQRIFKTRVALSRIGSSVLHASIATLMAVLIVSINPRSYFLIVFSKLWLGIVIIGMINSFLIIPIILSLIGPSLEHEMKKSERRSSFFK